MIAIRKLWNWAKNAITGRSARYVHNIEPDEMLSEEQKARLHELLNPEYRIYYRDETGRIRDEGIYENAKLQSDQQRVGGK